MASSTAGATEAIDTVDLSTLDEIVEPRERQTVWDAVPYEPAGLRDEDTPRFYVTGLLGASFATLNDPLYQGFRDGSINSTVLTAGGAAGIAFEREDGRLRLEFEGRGRDDLMRLSATGSRWT